MPDCRNLEATEVPVSRCTAKDSTKMGAGQGCGEGGMTGWGMEGF